MDNWEILWLMLTILLNSQDPFTTNDKPTRWLWQFLKKFNPSWVRGTHGHISLHRYIVVIMLHEHTYDRYANFLSNKWTVNLHHVIKSQSLIYSTCTILLLSSNASILKWMRHMEASCFFSIREPNFNEEAWIINLFLLTWAQILMSSLLTWSIWPNHQSSPNWVIRFH